MRSSPDDEEWIPDTDHDRHAVLAQLERLIGSPSNNEWAPGTEQDQQAVLAQLERMLEDARFRFNDHYPRFLRFVVEEAVRGSTDGLNERELGVEIFGRAADYDLNSDPVVRVTAAEISDRIAQYYSQEEHSAEWRIDLPYGSYIPRFRQPLARVARVPDRTQAAIPEKSLVLTPDISQFRQPRPHVTQAPDRTQAEIPNKSPILASEETKTSTMGSESRGTSRLVQVLWALLLVIVGLTAVIAFGMAKRHHVDAVASFWQFGGDNPSTVMVCIREIEPSPGMPNPGIAESPPMAPRREGMISYSDVIAVTKISSAITSAGLTPVLRATNQTTLADLQQGPVAMIGAPDNDWTLRLTYNLPFRFAKPSDGGAYQILDARSAVPPVYSIDNSRPYSALTQDYGIVVRFLNPITGRPTVIVAGLGANGSEAATGLVTSNDLFRQFLESAPKDWQKRNFEILLATQAIDGKPGPPKILAAQYW
jgi:hypothetical protein